jgi:hypothetical protein
MDTRFRSVIHSENGGNSPPDTQDPSPYTPIVKKQYLINLRKIILGKENGKSKNQLPNKGHLHINQIGHFYFGLTISFFCMSFFCLDRRLFIPYNLHKNKGDNRFGAGR